MAVSNTPTRTAAKRFDRIKVITAFDTAAAVGPWTRRSPLPRYSRSGCCCHRSGRRFLKPLSRKKPNPGGQIVAMNNAEFQLHVLGDPQIGVGMQPARPARMAMVDRGHRILWANPVGARVFDAANAAALTLKVFGLGGSGTGGRSRSLPTGCRKMARSGWSACAASALRPACSRPAARASIFPMAATASWSRQANALRPHHAAGRTAAAAGRRHRLADRGVCPRRHVHRAPAMRRVRCSAFAICSKPASTQARAVALKQENASKRRWESATWCCSVSARAPMSAWSR